MGRKRKTRAAKERHAARLKATLSESAQRPDRGPAASAASELPIESAQPAARLGPKLRHRKRQREDGTEVDIVEALAYFVERQETTFGFKHPLPHMRFAMFGKRRVERDGPFNSWAEARAYAQKDGGHGVRIVSEWIEARERGRIAKRQDGMVALVAAGVSVAAAAEAYLDGAGENVPHYQPSSGLSEAAQPADRGPAASAELSEAAQPGAAAVRDRPA